MSNLSNGLNNQLKKLVIQDGLSVEQAAELLELDVDACLLALNSMGGTKEVDCEELINKHKSDCIQALIDIGLDTSIENVSARVGALKIIVERKGTLPELAVDKLDEIYKRMKNVTEKYNKEAEAHIAAQQNPTTVVIENNNITKTNNFDEKFKAAREREKGELCHTK